MTTPNDIPAHADGPAYDPLPEQEAIFRPAVRFGNIPIPHAPLGWNPRNPGFRDLYPIVNLPTQIAERVQFGAPELEPSRLIWGDCLHVMRQIPSATIDLIYIDPPFFSGRDYNVIWGDDNELRSFSDVWQGGLDGYLIWLNARLYEMKRLLRPTGSIYVHCDWHASHYIKAEMDKIFGYENFRNEIVWHHPKIGIARVKFTSNTDSILFYTKTNNATFFPQTSEEPNELAARWSRKLRGMKLYYREAKTINDSPAQSKIRVAEKRLGRRLRDDDVVVDFDLPENKKAIDDVWKIPFLRGNSKETQGYPTQKPETLVQYILQASSNEGDTVADFFIGGGTTAAVAQRLGRRFIACDQSRVAVAVTAERLKQAAQGRLNEERYPDFTIEQWGIYEAHRLADASPEEFRAFVLECYDARIPSADEGIHGYKGAQARVPVWVGLPALDATVTTADVQGFAQSIANLPRYAGDEALRDGIMLAWGFTPGALNAAEELRGRGAADIAFVRLEQVRIDSPSFRRHVASQSTERGDYSNFLTFAQPPEVSFVCRQLKTLRYAFDASDTKVYGSGAQESNEPAKIINVQWDFNYDGQTFRAERRPWSDRASLTAQHQFPAPKTYAVACKAQDDKGGEGMQVVNLEVS